MGTDWTGYAMIHEDGDAGLITAMHGRQVSVQFVSGSSWKFSVTEAAGPRSSFAYSPFAANVAAATTTDRTPPTARLELLKAFCELIDQYRTADAIQHWESSRCGEWFPRDALNTLVAVREQIRDAALHQRLRKEVERLLEEINLVEADRVYATRCSDWWPAANYEAERARFETAGALADTITRKSLANVLHAFEELPPGLLTADELAHILLEKTRLRLARTGMRLDDHQILACARPDRNRLIRARAGSGKTRTLAAFAALAIADEELAPDQVLTLAFNTKAAREIGDRIRSAAGLPAYRNARTFHSLAHTLVSSAVRELIGNQSGSSDPSTQLQSQYVERVLYNVLSDTQNQDFRDSLYEFFRKEIEDVERLGSHLHGDPYFAFRRAMEHCTLAGKNVKSSGEKFIADFLFEHGISYEYERMYSWDNADRLDGTAYRPDFTLFVESQPVILEHWAIDPDDPAAQVPDWWHETTTEGYRRQIDDKRDYWRQRGIRLLETHTGMLREGREAFEAQLKELLERASTRCVKRDRQELVEAIARSRPAISRMAKLFVGFISRAKKRGWSVEQVRHEVGKYADAEPRNRIFHELAVRAYAEYEALLHVEDKWDFDDLLLAAIDAVKQQGASARIGLNHNRDSIAVGDLRWILIDEFQDFSELYYRLINAIRAANPKVRIVAVGDDWQAINGFAGAQLTFFEHFADCFDGGRVAAITTNYRSDMHIVEAGNGIMQGLGEPALVDSSKRGAGSVDAWDIKRVWVGNDDGDQCYLDAATKPESTPDSPKINFDLAKTLKACGDFVIDSVYQRGDKRWIPKVLLLSRTNHAYHLSLHEFERRLRKALEQHPALVDVANRWAISPGDHGDEPLVQVMTAHGAKGKEADTVIILQATDHNFPKVHADNQLFGPFGVTASDTLTEERRLFYVAVTRAEHRLLVLTESGKESLYLGALTSPGSVYAGVATQAAAAPLGEFAATVMQRLKAVPVVDRIRNDISGPARAQLDRLMATGLSVPEVGHFEDDCCAELAWPSAQPRVAVLTGRNAEPDNVKVWRDDGWRVIAAQRHT